MSTKIYNAYKWGGSDRELLQFLRNTGKQLLQKGVELVQKYIADKYVNLCDLHDVYGQVEIPESWLMFFYDELGKLVQLEASHSAIDFSVKVEAVIYMHDNNTFFQVFVNNRVLEDALISILVKEELCEGYSYWNNVDQPDDLSEQEWEERKAVWDNIFSTGIPCVDGLSVNLLDINMVQIVAEPKEICKSLQERAEEFAFDKLVTEKLTEPESRRLSMVNNLEKRFPEAYKQYVEEFTKILKPPCWS